MHRDKGLAYSRLAVNTTYQILVTKQHAKYLKIFNEYIGSLPKSQWPKNESIIDVLWWTALNFAMGWFGLHLCWDAFNCILLHTSWWIAFNCILLHSNWTHHSGLHSIAEGAFQQVVAAVNSPTMNGREVQP